MAKREIIIARLPGLIADRSDALKLETAIRYVGNVIFDGSQDPGGPEARWLAEVLSGPTSPEEAQSREAILSLFRDGYLDRYADYSAWTEIARAAGITSDPERVDPFSRQPAPVGAPKVIALTKVLEPTAASIQVTELRPAPVEPVETLTLSIPAESENARTRILEAPGSTDETPERTNAATAFLEITSFESTGRNPIEFAQKFKTIGTRDLTELELPCLVGFVPKIFSDQQLVEWSNLVTADSFVDHGDRLTSDSPSRLAIRAMLELARADNWTSMAVKGSVRLQAFAEATAAELDRQIPVTLPRGTAGAPSLQVPRPSTAPTKRRLRSAVGLSMGLLVLAGLGFGVSYTSLDQQLQKQLGVKWLFDNLRDKLWLSPPPLVFKSLSVATSSPSGSALSPPKSIFSQADLAKDPYLKWIASFQNGHAGLEGHDRRVEARILNPGGRQIATSADQRFVSPTQRMIDFSGVAVLPEPGSLTPGAYVIALYSDAQLLAERRFDITTGSATETRSTHPLAPDVRVDPGSAALTPTSRLHLIGLQQLLSASGYDSVKLRIRDNHLVLNGTVASEADRSTVERLCTALGFDSFVDELRIAPDSSAKSNIGQRKFHVVDDLGSTGPTGTTGSTGPTGPTGDDGDIPFWRSIESSEDPREYEAYLKQYPNGRFAELAKLRVSKYGDSNSLPSTPKPVSTPTVNRQLSDELSSYLHQQKLPFVDALVWSDPTGGLHSIKLSGRVATEQGKLHAESKARNYLNGSKASIDNQIVVDPTLASNPPALVLPDTSRPSAGCATDCQTAYVNCSSACQSKMTAEVGAAQAGSAIPPIIGGLSGSYAAVVAANAASGLAQSAYRVCASNCLREQTACTQLCH